MSINKVPQTTTDPTTDDLVNQMRNLSIDNPTTTDPTNDPTTDDLVNRMRDLSLEVPKNFNFNNASEIKFDTESTEKISKKKRLRLKLYRHKSYSHKTADGKTRFVIEYRANKNRN